MQRLLCRQDMAVASIGNHGICLFLQCNVTYLFDFAKFSCAKQILISIRCPDYMRVRMTDLVILISGNISPPYRWHIA